jgi:hypothetical protein
MTYGQTSWSATSDVTLKKDIATLTPSLNKILSLRPVTYHWNSEDTSQDPSHVGLIAQEVETVIPEVVDTDVDGKKSIRYSDLIPYLIKSIQELHALLVV